MKKMCIVTQDFYLNNRLFNIEDKISNRDDCLRVFYLLKNELEKYDIDLSTYDINSIEESENVIYFGMPDKLPTKSRVESSYLLLFENPVIAPNYWVIEKHKYFKKIFTWHDDFIDNKKYFKLNFPHDISSEITINKDVSKKQKLCCLIAMNKSSNHSLDLYSKRIEAIRWFEKYHPEDFDLYGIGWDEHTFKGFRGSRILNKIRFISKIFAPFYASYRGKIEVKHDILSKYMFSICYENTRDISGWITEKIFDSFFAGCVPIYWGANNITDHVPKECFIDKREFENYEYLYNYLKNLSKGEYLNYLDSAENFLKNARAYPFSYEYYIKTIINEMKIC